jgi:Ubiquitin-like domain
MQRNNQEKLESKLENLDEKLDKRATAQEISMTQLQRVVESAICQSETALTKIQSNLKLDWLRELGTELKGMVSQIFTINGTTLSAVRRIEEQLQSRSNAALARTFTFEDALGRVTQVDMVYVSSWDAFDGMLEACFRGCPGHSKVAEKDYVFQDRETNRELQRSMPWSAAMFPGRSILMAVTFRRNRQRSSLVYYVNCKARLEETRWRRQTQWLVPHCIVDFKGNVYST